MRIQCLCEVQVCAMDGLNCIMDLHRLPCQAVGVPNRQRPGSRLSEQRPYSGQTSCMFAEHTQTIAKNEKRQDSLHHCSKTTGTEVLTGFF